MLERQRTRRLLRPAAILGLSLVVLGCAASATTAPAATTAPGGQAVPSAAGRPVAVKPPTATPLASAPASPSGDGTKAVLQTTAGTITIELFTNSAPVAAQNFANLVSAGFYDGVPFHRIIPGFMIQGGDPTGTGSGGPGYSFPDEPFAGEYTRGMVAMANAGPNTNGSQFFIMVADYPLDRNYTIFGRVVSGMDAADRIVSGPNSGSPDNRALDPQHIVKATLQRP